MSGGPRGDRYHDRDGHERVGQGPSDDLGQRQRLRRSSRPLSRRRLQAVKSPRTTSTLRIRHDHVHLGDNTHPISDMVASQ